VEGTVRSTEIVYRRGASDLADRGFHRRARVAFFISIRVRQRRSHQFDVALSRSATGIFGGEDGHPRFRCCMAQLAADGVDAIYPTTAGLTQLGCGL